MPTAQFQTVIARSACDEAPFGGSGIRPGALAAATSHGAPYPDLAPEKREVLVQELPRRRIYIEAQQVWLAPIQVRDGASSFLDNEDIRGRLPGLRLLRRPEKRLG